MQTYICSLSFTDSGVVTLNQTPDRRAAAKHKADQLGIKIKEIYMTTGETDMLYILEAPDPGSVAKLMLLMGASSNVRTRTAVAFTADEFDKMLKDIGIVPPPQ
jgi:uncharacterized protein with GYD domain